eukprot:Gb_17421 [translate_table: standard]
MLHEMNILMKMSQNRTMYIAKYTRAWKLTCLALDSLYILPQSFTSAKFERWNNMIDIDNPKNFLKFDRDGILCVAVREYMVPLHYIGKSGRSTKQLPISRDDFSNIVISMRSTLTNIARSLTLEIRERFPRDELLEAIAVVYPQYWNNVQSQANLYVDFQVKMSILVSHFCRKVQVNGEEIEGILDQSKLVEQSSCFGQTMWREFQQLEDPLKNGAITRLWNILGASQYLQENMSKYFKLADLCQTMILGSVEDERVFNLLSFLKSKLRSKLDKHLDPCLRLYVIKYNINNFPFDRALALWRSDCDRRGESSILNLSNPSTTDKDCMEIDNDILCQGDQVQDVEDEDQVENWQINNFSL